jgi:hypothetical protein
MSIGAVEVADVWEYLEKVPRKDGTAKIWSSDENKCLKILRGQDGDIPNGEYAWDDVNKIAVPLEIVKQARKDEMGRMTVKIFKVVKKDEAWKVTGKAPISTKCIKFLPYMPTFQVEYDRMPTRTRCILAQVPSSGRRITRPCTLALP